MSRVNVKRVIVSPKFRQVYTVTRTKGHYEKGKFILDEPIKFDISGYTRVNEDVYEYEVTQDEDKGVRDICSIVQPRDRVDIR